MPQSAISISQRRAQGADMPRGIFTKIRQGNPVKASSDAVNPKPVAFIEGRAVKKYGRLEIAAARAAFGELADRLAKFAQAGADLVDLALLIGGRLASLARG